MNKKNYQLAKLFSYACQKCVKFKNHALHIFLIKLLLLVFPCMFKEHQPRRSSENNPEQNWLLLEVTSATKDYCRQNHRSLHQPSRCNDQQQYRYNRTSQNNYQFNTYGSEKQDHHGIINSRIPTPYINYVPTILNEPIQ